MSFYNFAAKSCKDTDNMLIPPFFAGIFSLFFLIILVRSI